MRDIFQEADKEMIDMFTDDSPSGYSEGNYKTDSKSGTEYNVLESERDLFVRDLMSTVNLPIQGTKI